MESDKDLIRKKAVSWLNKQTYPPRRGNHFKMKAFIFSAVFISLVGIILVYIFADDIENYFKPIKKQFFLLMGILSVLFGFTVWWWLRRYRNF